MTILTTNLDQLPSNIPIVDSRGFPTQAFVFYLLKTIKKAGTDNTNFDNIQIEVDRIELGSGLHPDGSYAPDTSTHYIKTATSLLNADYKLDSNLYELNQRIEIEEGFKRAYSSFDKTMNYNIDGSIDNIVITSGATTLFTKTFYYSLGVLTSSSILDNITLKTLTYTYTYDINGIITNIHVNYT